MAAVAAALVALVAAPGLATAQGADGVAAPEVDEALGRPRTLPELLDFAAAHAPAVREAQARLGLGDAAIAGARRFQQTNPELEGALDLGLEGEGVVRYEALLFQRLEVAGERGLRREAAREQARALAAELARAEWDVHQQVHRLYRVGLIDEARLGLERETLGFTRELSGIAADRFEAGEEPRTSVIVAKAELAGARSRLLGARDRYQRTLRELGATIGWSAETPPRPAGALGAARPVPAREALLEKAYASDPQLAVLRARRDQADAELAFERRKPWPDPVVGLGYEREKLGATEVEDKVLFSLGVPLPLWDRNQGDIAAARARGRIAREAVESRRSVLKMQVLKQADAVESAYRQARIYEEEVLPALETQLELLQEGFRLGEMDLLDVMNARDRLLAVQRRHLDALEGYVVAVSALENLLGTSVWDTDED